MRQRRVEIWRGLRLDTERPHTWAFYYFLKRRGDRVEILARTAVSIDIKVTYCDEWEDSI
jgi:hypothetical protein